MRRVLLLTVLTSAALGAAAPTVFGRGSSFVGRTMKDWMSDLSDPSPEVRRGAAFALGKIGAEDNTPKVVDALTHSLRDKDAVVRDYAASGLGDVMTALGPQAPAYWGRTGPALQQALKDEKPQVRRSAAFALGSFGSEAAPARDDLIAAVADESALVRQNAAWAVGRLGKEAGEEGVTRLRDLLKDPEPLVRRDALHALGEVGNPTAHPAVAAMLKTVGAETDGVVRKAAVEALSKLIGPEDKENARELTSLLKEKDSETRLDAAFVLAAIGGAEAGAALPVLQAALKDDDVHIQELAAAALGGLGQDAAPAVPDLGKALTEAKEPIVRRNAAVSLAHIGPAARKAIPEILQALRYSTDAADEKYNAVRPFAAEVLVNIKFPANESALPAALKILQADPDPAVRQRCLWAMFDVKDLDHYKITPVLTAVLNETGADGAILRYDAARVLALRLAENAPDKTVDVLLDMLTNKTLVIYNGQDASVNVGAEGTAGTSAVKTNQGGDARFMAAEALGWMGRKSNRPDVTTALQEAAQDKDTRLSGKAKEALRLIK